MRNLLIIYLFCLTIQACAQNNNNEKMQTKISHQDSLRYVIYLDSASTCSLFSQKRQLYLDSALQIKPQNARLWQQKAMPLFKQKKYELGMAYIDMAVKYDDKTCHFLEYRAFIKCIFQKSYREAIKDFDIVIQKKGNSYVMDHTYEFYKGLCYLQLNKIDSAEYFITKCITEERTAKGEDWVHYLHFFYQGIAQMEKENYPKAIESFNNCLKKFSQLPDALYYKAFCLHQQRSPKAALELLTQAQEYLKRGYGINEDNAFYETYPYQINKFYLDSYVEGLKEQVSQEK